MGFLGPYRLRSFRPGWTEQGGAKAHRLQMCAGFSMLMCISLSVLFLTLCRCRDGRMLLAMVSDSTLSWAVPMVAIECIQTRSLNLCHDFECSYLSTYSIGRKHP